jgi:hypothetical protein
MQQQKTKSPGKELSKGHMHSLMAQQAFNLAYWHMNNALEDTYELGVITDWARKIEALKKKAILRNKKG